MLTRRSPRWVTLDVLKDVDDPAAKAISKLTGVGFKESVAPQIIPGTAAQTVASPLVDAAGRAITKTVPGRRPQIIPGDPEVQNITFAQADKIRSYLNQLGNRDDMMIPGVRALAKAVAADVDQAMQAAGRRLGAFGQEVTDAYAVARSTASHSRRTFNDEVIGNLISKATPEQITETLFQADRPTRVAQVREIIFNPKYSASIPNPSKLWSEIQGNFLRTVRSDAGEGVMGELSGAKLRTALERSGGTFKELFPRPEQRNALMTSARALELSQKGANRAGRNVFLALQIGAGIREAQYALSFGPAQPGSDERFAHGVILMAPAAAALALSNPRFAAMLISRAASRMTRAGSTTGAALARAVAVLRDSRIPFSFQDSEGRVTDVPVEAPLAGPPVAPFRQRPQDTQRPATLGELRKGR
jgi:hypothetical protein